MKAYTNVAQLLKYRENAVDMSTCRNFYQMQQAVARIIHGKEWSGEALTKLAMRHDGGQNLDFYSHSSTKISLS